MAKMRKILIAVDLSNFSMNALKKGIELAKEYGAEVTVLHIIKEKDKESWWGSILPPLRKEIIQTKDQIASLLARKISVFNKSKTKVNTILLQAKRPAVKIVDYVKKHKVDLLIIGAHGDYTLHDWFVGTTAEYIAKKISCPVLMLKKKNKLRYNRILLPIDFSPASQTAIDFAVKYFPKSKLHVIHIADKVYEELVKNEYMQGYKKGKKLQLEVIRLLNAKAKNLMQPFVKKGGKVSYQVKIGFPNIEINRIAKKVRPGLILMGTQGHKKHYYNWLGSIASHILIEIDNDILLVPAKKRPHTKTIENEQKQFIKKINKLTEERFNQYKSMVRN